VSTACGRKRRSGRVWHWICGGKRKPKAVNKPLHYFIVPERDKPGSAATVSVYGVRNVRRRFVIAPLSQSMRSLSPNVRQPEWLLSRNLSQWMPLLSRRVD
jgi:hypothetical protein